MWWHIHRLDPKLGSGDWCLRNDTWWCVVTNYSYINTLLLTQLTYTVCTCISSGSHTSYTRIHRDIRESTYTREDKHGHTWLTHMFKLTHTNIESPLIPTETRSDLTLQRSGPSQITHTPLQYRRVPRPPFWSGWTEDRTSPNTSTLCLLPD